MLLQIRLPWSPNPLIPALYLHYRNTVMQIAPRRSERGHYRMSVRISYSTWNSLWELGEHGKHVCFDWRGAVWARRGVASRESVRLIFPAQHLLNPLFFRWVVERLKVSARVISHHMQLKFAPQPRCHSASGGKKKKRTRRYTSEPSVTGRPSLLGWTNVRLSTSKKETLKLYKLKVNVGYLLSSIQGKQRAF